MPINRFANNPRQISKKEHARLEKDLADLGDLGGICHDLDTNSLIGGNQRSEIMGVISGGNVPVITETFDPPTKQGTVALGYIIWRGEKYAYRAVKGWTDEQRRRANIEANRAGGAWDVDVLANSWSAPELISFGFDEDWLREQGKMYGAVLNMLESEKPEPVDAEPQIDRAAELQEIWQVKRGDLWQIGEHRLLCGDSTVRADVERVMDGEKADMVFTDPPYNVEIVGGTHDPRDKKNFGKGPRIENDAMSDGDFDTFLNSAFSEMNEAMRPGAAFYVCAPAGRTETQFRNALDRTGDLPLRECIVWSKQQAVFGRQDYHWQHESILYGWKHGAAHYFCEDHTQTTVWSIDRPMRSEKEHPTQKPVELPSKAISNSSVVGNILYEPFGGSGTTLAACQNLSRKCRAIEISENYCSVILQRMQDAFPNLDIHLIERE